MVHYKTVHGSPYWNGTYIDQSKVMFIDWKLLWANVFFQSRGIGALKERGKKANYSPFQIEIPK